MIDETMPSFTGHRVKLPDGRWTLAEGGSTVFQSHLIKILAQHFGGSFKGKRILDLGCLEGGHSVAFAQLGAKEVIGVDARAANLECAEYLKKALSISTARFVRADVKTITRETFGPFDLILASGILYHLDDPFAFLSAMAETTCDLLAIDTHFAVEGNTGHAPSVPGQIVERSFGGRPYLGAVAFEHSPSTTREEVEARRWTAYSNSCSFVLTAESLKDMLWHTGFSYVTRVYMPRGYGCTYPDCRSECRGIFLARRSWA